MFKRIVVGVSKVPRAQEAARQGIELARTLGAELHLVTAFEAGDVKTVGRQREHAEGFLETMALETSVPVHPHALPGDPADVILQVVEQVDADLVIVGNKGMHGAGRILGSVPNSIAHKAPCSVLIVNTT